MSHYFYVKRSWLISVQGRRLWRACAWLSLLLLASWLLYGFAGDFLYQYPVLDRLAVLSLLIGALAAAATIAAMEYYLFTLDESGALAQMFWFAVLCFVPVGPAIYCLVVYSRSKYFQTEDEESASAFSARQP